MAGACRAARPRSMSFLELLVFYGKVLEKWEMAHLGLAAFWGVACPRSPTLNPKP